MTDFCRVGRGRKNNGKKGKTPPGDIISADSGNKKDRMGQSCLRGEWRAMAKRKAVSGSATGNGLIYGCAICPACLQAVMTISSFFIRSKNESYDMLLLLILSDRYSRLSMPMAPPFIPLFAESSSRFFL